MADAIRRIFETKRFKSVEVVASLSGNAVIVKKIALPVMTPAELAESIQWEAEQYIPFDIQDVNLDYQVLDGGGAESGKQTMDVLLVAAKKDKIADYTGVIAQAGRTPVIVDVDAFAVQNCFEANYGIDAGRHGAPERGRVGHQRQHRRAAISRSSRATSPSAATPTPRPSRRSSASPSMRPSRPRRGRPIDGVSNEDVQHVLRTVSEAVLLEIQKTFDFFKATTDVRTASIACWSAAAPRRSRASPSSSPSGSTRPVERLNPFKTIGFDAASSDVAASADVAPTAAVAVGLALRRMGDR